MDDWAEIAAWRRSQRERLIALRMALPVEERARRGEAVLDRLAGLNIGKDAVVSFYWPFRGEFDLRTWIDGLAAQGIRTALPVVAEKRRPMTFRLWSPGARMERGIWNILVPADGAEVVPNIVIAPLVGHDRDLYRLGYGGGYFDRTLAAQSPKPFVVGVGLSDGLLPTIHPQPHDIPMDLVLTEAGELGNANRA